MACYRALRRSEKLGTEALAALQARKLRAMLRHCFERVPFYRARFEALGVRSAEDVHPAILPELPTVERIDVREHADEMLAEPFSGQRLRHTTGGSTGTRTGAPWATPLRSPSWPYWLNPHVHRVPSDFSAAVLAPVAAT